MIKSLTAKQLRPACTAESLPFKTTAELEDPVGIVGQDRALKAVEFGIGVHHRGYNLYVMGPSGLGKHGIIRKYLTRKAADEEVPSDWCYVRNFEQDYKPYALKLPAGQGKLFQKDMKNLVEDLSKAINAAFEATEYQDQVQQIEKIFTKKQSSLIDKHVERAQSQNIMLSQTSSGFMLMPMKNGVELSEQEYEALPEDEKEVIDSKIENFQNELDYLIPEISRQRRENNIKLNKLNRKVALFATSNLIKDVKRRYKAFRHIANYLKSVQEDVLDHLEFFLEGEDEESSDSNKKDNALIRYQVNLIVDSSKKNGAPVIYLDNPTYHNLIGRIEYENRSSGSSTNFMLIKSGALLDANGGYIVIDAHKILSMPHAWEALKRSLYAKKVKIESLDQVLNNDTTITLEPEPIPLRIKVILLGNRLTYYILHDMDPDFAELFKVEADFDEEMDRDEDNTLLYARLIASRARKHNLRDLEAGAVARLIEFSSRIANNTETLSTRLRTIDDLLIETQYWAMQSDHQYITYDDVQHAIDAQIQRTERIQKLIQKDIQRGILLIDTDGSAIGQINGLSVYEVGKFSFGQPSRITASVHLGDGSIINIEREVDLSGSIHDKGVLILSALLANRYTRDTPLAFSASIAFEQSYGRIDGDSASLAELCVLISALTNIPLKQSYAVTGSLNQQGYVQAIGGVNEKIEGFFDICKQRGLTGDQGCIIPKINVMNLLLKKEVIDAIENKKFHIYPVNHYEQALEILTGFTAGEELADGNFVKDSLNDRIMRKLCAYAKMRKTNETILLSKS
ncbi:MAG: AAA family ATPase [Gammaproteobacteria bacterium]|nr:AAA family ATPase [Gammaproteobacteria bacterium]MDH5734815.1 AAA family ATPase [Gammaproteobacteria bacterium]